MWNILGSKSLGYLNKFSPKRILQKAGKEKNWTGKKKEKLKCL